MIRLHVCPRICFGYFYEAFNLLFTIFESIYLDHPFLLPSYGVFGTEDLCDYLWVFMIIIGRIYKFVFSCPRHRCTNCFCGLHCVVCCLDLNHFKAFLPFCLRLVLRSQLPLSSTNFDLVRLFHFSSTTYIWESARWRARNPTHKSVFVALNDIKKFCTKANFI